MVAVVSLQGHQYMVRAGDTIVVDMLEVVDDLYTTTDVVALFSEDAKDVRLGKPYIENASVSFSVVSEGRGDKIRVIKFKRKNRYERTFGHRSYQTTLSVQSING